MSTIAIIPSEVRSKAMLAHRLGSWLTGAGHRVVLIGGDAPPGATPLEHRPLQLHPASDLVVPRRRPHRAWTANRAAAAELDGDDLARLLDEVEADLVVVDIEEYEALVLLVAAERHERVAVLCSFFEVWPTPGAGPDDSTVATGPAGRLRARAAWWVLWGRLRLYGLKRLMFGGVVDRVAVARWSARRLGVRRSFSARQWLVPFAPRHLPTLVCNALELDLPHQPRPGVVHVGSLLRPVEALDDALRDALEEARATERPIVMCAFGSLGIADSFVDRLAEVAAMRPQYCFVVAGSCDHRLDELPNTVVREWLPQREVLEHAGVAVVHSGNATLHECVAARVPMVVYPFSGNDQRRNAARVMHHGLGEVGDRHRDDAETVAARLDRLLADDGVRRRLDELAPLVTRYERDRVAVAAVEELLVAPAGVTGAAHSPP